MVFCTKCGVENAEQSKYCQNCGKSLEKERLESWKTGLDNRKDKSPLAAVILNLLLAGLGIVYIKA